MNSVDTRDQNGFAARWLAYALPCRRFARVLADARARLGADVDRYSFTVVDLHHLLLAGLPAHSLAFAFRDIAFLNGRDAKEEALAHASLAIGLQKDRSDPTQLANLYHLRATVLADRISESREENIELAIEACLAGLKALDGSSTRECSEERELRSSLLVSLGQIYLRRIRGGRIENLNQAIETTNRGLEYAGSYERGRAYLNLARAHTDRHIVGGDSDILRAADSCNMSIEVYSQLGLPTEWAHAQNLLGTIFARRTAGDQYENLSQAIHHFLQALNVFTRTEFPYEWAGLHNNIGNALRHRFEMALRDQSGRESTKDLELAVQHCKMSLEIRTKEEFPFDWGTTQANIAIAYSALSKRSSEANLQMAISHFEAALTVLTPLGFPQDHQRVQTEFAYTLFRSKAWEQAHRAFSAAVSSGEELFLRTVMNTGRRAEVGESAWLYAADAFCLIQSGKFRQALVRLEEGKARLLSEALSLEDLQAVPGSNRLITLQRQAQNLELESQLPQESPNRRPNFEIAQALEKVRSEIEVFRRNAGLAIFGEHSGRNTILEFVPDKGAVILPVLTEMGSCALVICDHAQKLSADNVVQLNDLTMLKLHDLLYGADKSPDARGWLSPGATPAQWRKSIREACRFLGEYIFDPVCNRLREFGVAEGSQLLVIPQGGLQGCSTLSSLME